MTYEIVHENGNEGIKCACCEKTSWSSEDVRYKWCICLEEFHPIDLNSPEAKAERAKVKKSKRWRWF